MSALNFYIKSRIETFHFKCNSFMVYLDYLLKLLYKNSYAGQFNMQEFQFKLQVCIKSKQRTKLKCFQLSRLM